MGDTGSLFIGMLVGGLNVMGPFHYSRGTVAVLLLPVLLLLVPLFDTAFVTVARTLAGRSVAQGGRDHTSHRLVALGMSERGAVLALWAMAFGVGRRGGAVLPLRPALHGHARRLARRRLRRARREAGAAAGLPGARRRHWHGPRGDRLPVQEAGRHRRHRRRRWWPWPITRPTCCGSKSALDRELPMFAASVLIVLPCARADARRVQDLPGLVASRRPARPAAPWSAAATAGVALSMLVVLLLYRFQNYSRAVFAIHWLLVTTFLLRQPGAVPRPRRAVPGRAARGAAHRHLRRGRRRGDGAA